MNQVNSSASTNKEKNYAPQPVEVITKELQALS